MKQLATLLLLFAFSFAHAQDVNKKDIAGDWIVYAVDGDDLESYGLMYSFNEDGTFKTVIAGVNMQQTGEYTLVESKISFSEGEPPRYRVEKISKKELKFHPLKQKDEAGVPMDTLVLQKN